MSTIVQEVVAKAGGIAALARHLGIKHNSIYSWEQVPPKRVLEVERITGIPRHRLRPDMYPLSRGVKS